MNEPANNPAKMATTQQEPTPVGSSEMVMRRGTATLLKDYLPGFEGHAAHYRLDPPLEDEYLAESHQYVVVSAVRVFGRPETYIFPASEAGDVTQWGELSGSQRDTLRHEDALRDAGYSVA